MNTKRILMLFLPVAEKMEYLENGGTEVPRHHLWTYDQIKNSGYEVEVLPYREDSWLNRLGKRFRIPNLEQQLRCLLGASAGYDLIYAPWMNFTFLLALMKVFHLYRKPVIVVAGSAYLVSADHWLRRMKQAVIRYIYMKGIDKILFVNEHLYDASREQRIQGNTDFIRSWGVDGEFFTAFTDQQTAPPSEEYLCSIAGSRRDFGVLIEALRPIDCRLKIVSLGPGTFPEALAATLPAHVSVDNSLPPSLTSTANLRELVYHAVAVAIPMFQWNHGEVNGNKVMMEAFAMGKPVIITEDRFLPFSVEEKGVGLEVAPGDVAGWRRAIRYLLDHPEETRAMGRRARKLVEEEYNYRLFSEEVIRHIEMHISVRKEAVSVTDLA